jgi:hypothetical protein
MPSKRNVKGKWRSTEPTISAAGGLMTWCELNALVGSGHIFAQHALRAIGKAGGDMSKVEWKEVEAVAVHEAITQHRTDPKKVVAAFIKHSPGMVDQVRKDKARGLISTWSGKEIATSRSSKERDGPSR